MTTTPRLAINGTTWSHQDGPLRIGSAPDNHVVVAGTEVAAHHAYLTVTDGRWILRPLDPANSLWRDGHRVPAVGIDGPITVALGAGGGPTIRLAIMRASVPAASVQQPTPPAPVLATSPALTPPLSPPAPPPPSGREVVRIGRSPENDVVVPDLLVSRRHAELRWDGRTWKLLDLGSPNGCYVDGKRASIEEVRVGQRLTFGTKSYELSETGLVAVSTKPDGDQPPALAARHLDVVVEGGTRILHDVSLDVEQGEVLAIVGPSGSGKSTLLKALTGSRRPEQGAVQVRGVDLYENYDELCRSIGYVPQDDILHLPLPVRDALTFGAELRFPADTTADDHRERVDEVLAELELSHRADVPIETVSGGQRKRTSVALELLTRPDLLFLDEPTSGLDPGFERTVMELLRDLASAGRAVVVVTHSLQSLDLCDKVLFLAPGGSIAYFGPPAGALEFFGRRDFIEVFRALEAHAPAEWARRRGDDDNGSSPRSTLAERSLAPPRAAPPGQPWKAQVGILARRQIAILKADRQNLAFLAGSVLIPAFLILALMGSDTLRLGQDDPVVARQLLGAMVVAAVAIGAANAIREIVKEVPIYLRERAIGLQRSAYLTSKVLVIGALTSIQAAVLVLITTLRSGGPGRANLLLIPHLELIVGVVLTGLAAVALGLLLSTMVSSSEKAMALVPVVFVVQWLFSGAALDLQSKPVMREVAMVTSANWGMAAAASTVGEHELSKTCSWADEEYGSNGSGGEYYDGYEWVSSGAPPDVQTRLDAAPACDARWRTGAGPWFVSILALLVLTVMPVWAADRLLARREPLAAQRRIDWPGPWYRGSVKRF